MKQHLYHKYILTNPSRTSLYTGVTNNMPYWLAQHREEAALHNDGKYSGRYNCIHIVYIEGHQWIQDAIAREKEIKGWTRAKKLALIRSVNPEMRFLEEDW